MPSCRIISAASTRDSHRPCRLRIPPGASPCPPGAGPGRGRGRPPAYGVGHQAQAGADLAQFGGALQHGDPPPVPVQGQRRAQPANSPPTTIACASFIPIHLLHL
ncbi:hypothetical protein NKG94_10750 [Micromonospora sp. M12]